MKLGVRDELVSSNALSGELDGLTAELEQTLISAGLFQKEAHAMVETWRDSWFEEGSRIFYIMPASAVDAILPLKIEPRPESVARVFVGRVEVVTKETRDAVRNAIARDDRVTLEKYGRFLGTIAARIGVENEAVRAIRAKYTALSNACKSE